MSEVKYRVCDRCGEKLTQRHSELKIKVHQVGVALLGDVAGWKWSNIRFDFCSPCSKKLREFVRSHKHDTAMAETNEEESS